jgi:tetratricopeptide (TPR) repeat protein
MRLEPTITTAEIEEAQRKSEEEKKQKQKPQRSYGKLKVASNVPEAKVIIDNKVMGPANKTYSRLYAGKHKLVVMHEGFKEYSETININTNQTTEIDVKLEEIDLEYDPSEITYEEYLSKADDLASEGNWQEAAGNYTLALAKYEDGQTYYKRAQAFIKLSRNAQAKSDLFKAASFYVYENNLSQAMACYNDILDMDPENARALRNRGFVFLRKNDHKAALKDLERAKDIDDESFESSIALGEALYIMGNHKDALKYLKKARNKDKSNARAYALSALASMARGKDKDARKYYRGFEQRAGIADLNEFSSDPEWTKLKELVKQEDN